MPEKSARLTEPPPSRGRSNAARGRPGPGRPYRCPCLRLRARSSRYSVERGFVHDRVRTTEDCVDQEHPQHEKIKFRRDEIADLGALPSACRFRRSAGHGSAAARWHPVAAGLAGVWRCCWRPPSSVVLARASAPSGLRAEAETRHRETGRRRCPCRGRSGAHHARQVEFPGASGDDVSLKTADGKPMVEAGRVRFGVRLLPLLGGEVRLTSARISDARIVAAMLPSQAATGPQPCATRTA